MSDDLYVIAMEAGIDKLEARLESARHNAQKYAEWYHEARGERWSDDIPPGGWVCATCGMPVESEPCPEHSPGARIAALEAERASKARVVRASVAETLADESFSTDWPHRRRARREAVNALLAEVPEWGKGGDVG